MALEKDRELKGLPIPGAYCRIDWLRYDVPGRVGIGVGVYRDEAAANVDVLNEHGEPTGEKLASTENRLELVNYEQSVQDFGGKANINAAQAYEVLKEKEEWQAAKDN